MTRKIYFELFSTAWFNGEPVGADKQKMLCPLAAVVQQQGCRGKFLLLGNASIGKSSNIESFKIHLLAHNINFRYFNLNKLNYESFDKPKILPKDCIIILDSLDEVQKQRYTNDGYVDIRKEAEAFVNSFVNDPNVSCIVVASRFNPSKTKIEGYSSNFLKEFREISLSQLNSKQIDILIDKFKLDVERGSFAYNLFKTPMYLSMAVEMGEVDKAIEDEANFIDAYLNRLHKIKQSQNDKNDSFIDGSLFEMAYEMVRGRTYSKNVYIPQAFNTIFDLINVNNSILALNYSSVRYISFAAAKYIVNKFYQLYQEDDIDEKHIKRLLDFVVEAENLEMLKFAGELLRHHSQKDNIIKVLNAEEIKRSTDFYYNLTIIIMLFFKRTIDDVAFDGDDYEDSMRFDAESAITDSEFKLGERFLPMFLTRHDKDNHLSFFYNKIDVYWERLFTFNPITGFIDVITPTIVYIVLVTINLNSSIYVRKTIDNGHIYLGSVKNPYMCFLDHVNHEQENNPFNPFRKSLKTTIHIKRQCEWISRHICQQVDKFEVEADNECYASKDGVLYDISGTRLIRFPALKAGEIYDDPEENEKQERFVRVSEALKFPSLIATDVYTVPESVTSIEKGAFENCVGLIELFVSEKSKISQNEIYEKCKLPRKCKIIYY